MTNIRRALLGLAAVALTCGFANATQLTESFTITINLGTYDTTNYGGLLNVQGFNPALGTLNDLSINLASAITSNITASTTATTEQSGTQKTEVGIAIDDAAISLNPSTFAFTAPGGNFSGIPQIDQLTGAFSFDINPGPGSASSGPLSTNGSATLSDITNAAILSEFTTAGIYSGLNFLAAAQTTGTEQGGNASISQATTATLTGTVVYDYTPPFTGAPEPATLFLMGSALVGVGLLRKRLKA